MSVLEKPFFPLMRFAKLNKSPSSPALKTPSLLSPPGLNRGFTVIISLYVRDWNDFEPVSSFRTRYSFLTITLLGFSTQRMAMCLTVHPRFSNADTVASLVCGKMAMLFGRDPDKFPRWRRMDLENHRWYWDGGNIRGSLPAWTSGGRYWKDYEKTWRKQRTLPLIGIFYCLSDGKKTF